jgi:hypothetical protein
MVSKINFFICRFAVNSSRIYWQFACFYDHSFERRFYVDNGSSIFADLRSCHKRDINKKSPSNKLRFYRIFFFCFHHIATQIDIQDLFVAFSSFQKLKKMNPQNLALKLCLKRNSKFKFFSYDNKPYCIKYNNL